MQAAAKFIAPLALALTIVPPCLFMFHAMSEQPMKHVMLAGCVLWFVAAPFSMKGGSK